MICDKTTETGFFLVPLKPTHEVPSSVLLPIKLESKNPEDAAKEASSKGVPGYLCWITCYVGL